jgi:hypothetical protein
MDKIVSVHINSCVHKSRASGRPLATVFCTVAPDMCGPCLCHSCIRSRFRVAPTGKGYRELLPGWPWREADHPCPVPKVKNVWSYILTTPNTRLWCCAECRKSTDLTLVDVQKRECLLFLQTRNSPRHTTVQNACRNHLIVCGDRLHCNHVFFLLLQVCLTWAKWSPSLFQQVVSELTSIISDTFHCLTCCRFII